LRKTPAIMFQGTGSDVGKSLLIAGLARAYVKRGLAVRPFKPQNMSNNAAVTQEGGEIGRAQELQARACGLEPANDMNPVLLKPQSDTGAQVVVQGKVLGSAKARDYADLKGSLLPKVLESFERLCEGADLILVEGAGSAAEVNLRRGDIANMGFAEAADIPVVVIGDIDRGGVIASLVGTWELLPENERKRLAGYLINKFRGDPALFRSGDDIIAQRTGLRSFGLVPFFPAAARLPAEDALALEKQPERENGSPATANGRDRPIRFAVPKLSRIANFDDLDPLCLEPDVTVDFIAPGEPLPGDADCVLLPGSKATLADLRFFREQGWDIDLAAHHRRGGVILGLCGGYQMLGRRLSDPKGIEGPPEETEGLGFLDLETELGPEKTLQRASGHHKESGTSVSGYEMHIGISRGVDLSRPFLELAGRAEGACSADGRVMGTYLHGLFAEDAFRRAFLEGLRPGRRESLAYRLDVEKTLDLLAAHLEAHLDLDALLEAAHAQ
jgi:adenosylcobyric acid synthase